MKLLGIALWCVVLLSCSKSAESGAPPGTTTPTNVVTVARPASLGIVGDTSDVTTTTKGGTVMMGGGTDVDAAFKWMIDRSGGGDVVILRATGTDAYNDYVYKLGKVNSVETLKIDSRTLANDDAVARVIRNAEVLFIAGGDQSDYMNYWRGTKTMDAINYLVNVKHVPVGGTSAGCAILSGFYYSGEGGSIVSDDALANPYNSLITLYNNDFLHLPYLQQVITDMHYITRNRQGRHVAFLSRVAKDWGIFAKGVAEDERTAVCMDENGKATVYGSGTAYFILTDATKAPEKCVAGSPLNWDKANQALKVYVITGSATGSGNFDLAGFNQAEAAGGKWFWWWVENGVLKQLAI